ncbi:hypothetical protein B0I31_113200 [Saccharothrix carnea]|uniref:Secreted protein n=1 Tax=Saccharothrix carnea TaxID=1280637 RepID=A0A2P8I225_SACCR|nr:hypothetical protein [Saccharothrix carnea]PSL52527.1 hypothetical protein B0I31_113200 [Saccharothrix carnea]
MTSPLLPRIGRAAAVVVAAAATTLALTGGASADPTAASVAFKAEHTDRCLSSYTAGQLAWRNTLPVPPPNPVTAVKVTGEVALRNITPCAPPANTVAVAVFTAYNGRTVVDTERQGTTSATKFEFTLTVPLVPTPVPVPIDRVTVQVCHTTITPIPEPGPITCGDISTYPIA